MPEPSNDRQEYLDYWLKQATTGLCEQARARIRAEVEAHFDDAMAEALAAGLDEARAAHTAFVALGDPLAARRNFHQVYLSDLERKEIRDLLAGPSTSRKIFCFLYCLSIQTLLLFIAKQRYTTPINSFLIWAFWLASGVYLISAIAQCFWHRLSNAWRIYHREICQMPIYLFISFCTNYAPPTVMLCLIGIFALFYLLFVALQVVMLSFSLRKMRRNPEMYQ